LSAQTVAEYQLKAELIERFTRFIEWPAQVSRGSFVIGVIGENPFNTYLDDMAKARKIKGRIVDIQRIDDPAGAERCHVLFISSSARSSLPAILAHTRTHPVLTIGDTDGFGEAGVDVNFYNAGDTVRFEINETALEKGGLHASSKLLKLARIVESEVR
jgi:hypothetical protein